jgi:hypothetical protein
MEQIMKPKTMNKLVQAIFKRDNMTVKLYRHSVGKTGMFVSYSNAQSTHQKIWDVDVEAFFMQFSKLPEYELLETVRQVRERELGNSDEAYETTVWKNGRVVGHKAGRF